MPDEGRIERPRPEDDRLTPKHSQARRRLLKSLAAGGGVVAGATLLPDRWVKPVVDLVVVPAHAQASGPSMTAFLTIGSPFSTQVNASGTVDGSANTDNNAVNVDGQATLINPPVPGQAVTLSFAFNNAASDATLDADPFPAAVPTDPGTGIATFGNALIQLDTNFGIDADLDEATLSATFSSPGVPSVVITVDFA
jgi:hypothetical protein